MSEFGNLANLNYIEALYQEFLKNPASIEASWRYFFEGLQFASQMQLSRIKEPLRSEFHEDLRSKELLEAYREFGHLAARTNPFKEKVDPESIESLNIKSYGFGPEDLEEIVETYGMGAESRAPLKVFLQCLQEKYSGSFGVEFSYCDQKIKEFIQGKLEKESYLVSQDRKKSIFRELNQSEMFESFVHTKYPGVKRFSLEGGETLIPILSEIISEGGQLGVHECVLGMAHRGRLNVLTNVLKKDFSAVFHEFEPTYEPNTFEGSGDVKYHRGLKTTVVTDFGKEVKLRLVDNPSHLETVDPVALGMTRALQTQVYQDKYKTKVLSILVHGDASVTGQGVIYECCQLYKLDGYSTGGTIHVVINNQVGFTATEKESRSTLYSTDIAKTFSMPVFHVNAEDPEACVFVANLAVKIRQEFHVDVWLEMMCYRKYGHNEGDEPAFTQPELYQKIRNRSNIRDLYKRKLLDGQVVTEEEIKGYETDFKEHLQVSLQKTQELLKKKKTGSVDYKPPAKTEVFKRTPTAVDKKLLIKLAKSFCSQPQGIQVHPKVIKLFTDRMTLLEKGEGIDWGMAEYLAYATLLQDRASVRISGQDSQRGTFSHRHAVIVDQTTSQKYYPLQHLFDGQPSFDVYNSCLSEYAILGFEFGYSIIATEGLTIWEAQFGDFANGAQIIIDQYIASCEQKWSMHSSLTLMLPHGYEGQGPEHSSARIERFLQLAGHWNMQVVIPTTPSQLFHVLRRQVLSKVMKPLIIFMPKALLRYPPSLSSLSDFTTKDFQEIIVDSNVSATRLLICSGKVYYDLLEEKKAKEARHIGIIRLEQLYPFDVEKLQDIIRSYSQIKECYWVQEEHSNMGAYSYMEPLLREILPSNVNLCYVGRARSASPAAGSHALHQKEKTQLLKEAFGETAR